MAPNGRSWTITLGQTEINWPAALRQAIVSNARSYLNPPIKNLGVAGIRKTAALLPGWFGQIEAAPLGQIGMLMERAGTGGALFRHFYQDFLTEANGYLHSPAVTSARDRFAEAAPLWTAVADHIMAAETAGVGALQAAVPLLHQLADLEEAAVTELLHL